MALRRTVSVLALLVAASIAAPVYAEDLRGVALVIGQADYEALSDLGNPLNDARAMDDLLSELGFDVTRVLDRGGERLKREIEDFVADAAGADVALVYYAGHAVEAAGENYLVPVDADLATPSSAGESLVSVGALLEELARTVPVTIALLDACRTDAFPDGSAVILPGSTTPVEIGGTGLGEMRGPTPVLANIDPESLGMVIGFAAAPGQAALDGEPGGNSPYAAALLKHMGAGGYAFGDLLTMVTEEVYLKTGARQIPWTNSSLRRVLSFGQPIEANDDEQLIRDGRRKLLLTIAATPADVRRQVEAAAQSGGVPMDTLYGLLDALGEDVPSDPAALDEVLRTQTANLRTMMKERRALTSTDAEIVRLTGLAQRAINEGALEVSLGFWEQAKARYLDIGASLDATETQLRQRRIEGGALLASVADAYVLSGDYAVAAENFRLAYAEVERWDDALAIDYKGKEADAWSSYGDQAGDNEASERAIALYTELGDELDDSDVEWGALQMGLGRSYARLGSRTGDNQLMQKGLEAFRSAIDFYDRDEEPSLWANAQSSLGAALSVMGAASADSTELRDAVGAYRAALAVLSPNTDASDWARAQGNLAGTLNMLGQRENAIEHLREAAKAAEAAMSVDTRERAPLSWANLQNTLGTVLMFTALQTDDTATFREAVDAYRAALEVLTREVAPLQWAMTQGNLGTSLWQLGEATNDGALIEEAIAAHKAALTELRPERALGDWTLAMSNLASAQMALGNARGRADDIMASVASYREVLAHLEREQGELQWALVQNNLGATLNVLGNLQQAPEPFREAEAALRASLAIRTTANGLLEWAASQKNLGDALVGQSKFAPGTEELIEAVAAFRASIDVRRNAGPPGDRAHTEMTLADTLFELGIREDSGTDRYSEALDAYTAAATYYTPEAYPLDYATIADKAGWVLANVGHRTGNREPFALGRAAIEDAWRIVKASGQTEHDAYFSERLALIDEAVSKLPPAQ